MKLNFLAEQFLPANVAHDKFAKTICLTGKMLPSFDMDLKALFGDEPFQTFGIWAAKGPLLPNGWLLFSILLFTKFLLIATYIAFMNLPDIVGRETFTTLGAQVRTFLCVSG